MPIVGVCNFEPCLLRNRGRAIVLVQNIPVQVMKLVIIWREILLRYNGWGGTGANKKKQSTRIKFACNLFVFLIYYRLCPSYYKRQQSNNESTPHTTIENTEHRTPRIGECFWYKQLTTGPLFSSYSFIYEKRQKHNIPHIRKWNETKKILKK